MTLQEIRNLNLNVQDRIALNRLVELGIVIIDNDEEIRRNNVGKSNYSEHTIQPWSIILDWNLNFFEGNILKYLLRTKANTPREEDLRKIIHYAQEMLRQIRIKESNRICKELE